ncbi:hypothetical protein ACVXHB_10265 [Escherichia coli]
MREMGVTPTHVLLQAGVGAMAGGVLGYLVDVYSPQNLHSIIVEPDKADCIYRPASKATSSTLAVIWPPSWQAWPVANLTRWAGKST